jgi:hypothetical protein
MTEHDDDDAQSPEPLDEPERPERNAASTAARKGKDETASAEDNQRLRQRIEAFVPDLIRRTFYAGLGAVFTSEDGLRRLANEFSLPKDVANYLITQAQGSKDELFRIIGKELRRFLENLNLNEELQRLLTSLSFEIRTEIRFVPNEAQPPRPKVKQRVKVKRSRGTEVVETEIPVPSDDAPAE